MPSQTCSYCGYETTNLSDEGTCRACTLAMERVIDFTQALARRLRCMEPGCTTKRRFDVTAFGHIVTRQPADKNIYCGLHVRRIARLLRRGRVQQAA
jgi:hypothetical protein